jgi:hypothetical protein
MKTGSEAPGVPSRRVWRLVGGVVVGSFLLVGHWWYWYAPRIRPARPSQSRLSLVPDDCEVGLWIPYPHQNLAVLRREVGDLDAFTAAVAGLLGMPAPRLPHLGSGPAPPADELVLTRDREGRTRVEVQMYPLAAVLVRLAGGLAGNPWLMGGPVEAEDHGALQVSWQGRVWRLAPDGGTGGRGGGSEAVPVLAVMELGSPRPPLPAGRYLLQRTEGRDLVWALEGTKPEVPVLRRPSDALLTVTGRGPGGRWGVELFDRASGVHPDLPAAVAFATSEAADLLPGGQGLRRLAHHLPGRSADGLQLVALDQWSLQRGEELLESVTSDADFELAVRLGRAAERWQRLVRLLDDLSLVGVERARRWQEGVAVLAALGDFDWAVVRVDRSRRRAEVRLVVGGDGSSPRE